MILFCRTSKLMYQFLNLSWIIKGIFEVYGAFKTNPFVALLISLYQTLSKALDSAAMARQEY